MTGPRWQERRKGKPESQHCQARFVGMKCGWRRLLEASQKASASVKAGVSDIRREMAMQAFNNGCT